MCNNEKFKIISYPYETPCIMYIGMYTIVQWSSVSIDKNMKLDQYKAQLIHASRSHFICKKRKLALVVQQSL